MKTALFTFTLVSANDKAVFGPSAAQGTNCRVIHGMRILRIDVLNGTVKVGESENAQTTIDSYKIVTPNPYVVSNQKTFETDGTQNFVVWNATTTGGIAEISVAISYE